MAEVTQSGPDQPGDDQDGHVGYEEIGRDGENAARFAEAA